MDWFKKKKKAQEKEKRPVDRRRFAVDLGKDPGFTIPSQMPDFDQDELETGMNLINDLVKRYEEASTPDDKLKYAENIQRLCDDPSKPKEIRKFAEGSLRGRGIDVFLTDHFTKELGEASTKFEKGVEIKQKTRQLQALQTLGTRNMPPAVRRDYDEYMKGKPQEFDDHMTSLKGSDFETLADALAVVGDRAQKRSEQIQKGESGPDPLDELIKSGTLSGQALEVARTFHTNLTRYGNAYPEMLKARKQYEEGPQAKPFEYTDDTGDGHKVKFVDKQKTLILVDEDNIVMKPSPSDDPRALNNIRNAVTLMPLANGKEAIAALPKTLPEKGSTKEREELRSILDNMTSKPDVQLIRNAGVNITTGSKTIANMTGLLMDEMEKVKRGGPSKGTYRRLAETITLPITEMSERVQQIGIEKQKQRNIDKL